MMPPKHTHDFAEVFDGVPSMHDAKASVLLAKVQAIKPARAWAPDSNERRDMRAWVDQRRRIGRALDAVEHHTTAFLLYALNADADARAALVPAGAAAVGIRYQTTLR